MLDFAAVWVDGYGWQGRTGTTSMDNCSKELVWKLCYRLERKEREKGG